MTKLVTGVAVMQLAERGLLSLDTDVRDSIPRLKDIKILDSVQDEGTTGISNTTTGINSNTKRVKQPVYRPIEGKITLR